MAYAKSKMDYTDKVDQLWDWVTNTGDGISGFRFGDIPPGCLDFIMSQYHRFNVPFPIEIMEVAIAGASCSFHFADCIDPYAMYHGCSDVEVTDEWAEHTYEVFDADGSPFSKEVDPEHTETFRLIPGQCEAYFERQIAMPGLGALPFWHGAQIDDMLDGTYNGEDATDSVSHEVMQLLHRLCAEPGGMVDERKVYAYFELAAWAGWLWLVGPYGRQYRYEQHEIMQVCLDHGEAILVDGTIIPPTYYRKHARPPQSCYKCGTQAWCVVPTAVSEATYLICEACLNFDSPKFGNVNCGTKLCKEVRCPNHPYHAYGDRGRAMALREHGQLMAMARGESHTRILGGHGRPLELPF